MKGYSLKKRKCLNEKNIFSNALEISKRICKLKLNDGDVAVDCTMGNGNDTAFLCRLVGEKGKVYAFDVQKSALANTTKRLQELNYMRRAELILDGHQNLDQYIKRTVKLAIFNLGYLPRGNHLITTKRETTLEAVRKCLNVLEPNGAILLVVYSGHESGKDEKEGLEIFTSQLDQKAYNIINIAFPNQINNPPGLICIEKVLSK